jgi:transposase
MESDRRSAQLERHEVVDTGRRRRWSEDEKLKIVPERLQAPRQVAATARRYGVSRSLLPMTTVVSLRAEGCRRSNGLRTGDGGRGIGAAPGPVGPAGGGAIEIEFAAGARMRITGTVKTSSKPIAPDFECLAFRRSPKAFLAS